MKLMTRYGMGWGEKEGENRDMDPGGYQSVNL